MHETVCFSGIQTQIFGVEGEHANHLTTTTVPPKYFSLSFIFTFQHEQSPHVSLTFARLQIGNQCDQIGRF